MSSAIVWTPRGEAATQTLSFATTGIQTLAGFGSQSTARAVSVGGKASSVVADHWFEYQLRVDAISRESDSTVWSLVSALISHIEAGGEFSFRYDSTETTDTTTDAGVSKGDTVIPVTSTTGFSAGDWIYIEDVNDPTKYEIVKIDSVSAGVSVTVDRGVSYGFGNGSVARHWQYHPACVITREPDWRERPAGQGANVWDLRIDFRTVR